MFFFRALVLVAGVAASPLFQGKQFVDLSHPYDDTTLYWPGGEPFHFTRVVQDVVNGTWYSAHDFATAEHSGTHIDAPAHFKKEGTTVGNMPLSKFFVTGVIVNVSSEVNGDAGYKMGKGPLEAWEAEHGPMPDNSVVLILFGWASRWPDKLQYLGPSDKDLRFPGITEEAVQWLNNKNSVVGIGVDTLSPDIPGSLTFPAHVTLLGNEKYILENIRTPRFLPHTVQLVILPMRIGKGTGGPTRVVALL